LQAVGGDENLGALRSIIAENVNFKTGYDEHKYNDAEFPPSNLVGGGLSSVFVVDELYTPCGPMT